MIDFDVVVIGAGPAGMSAAIAASDEKVSVLLLDRNTELGGILPQCIHAGFGARRFKEDLPGPLYAHRLIEELKKRPVEVWLDSFVLDVSPSRKVTVLSKRGYEEIQARSIVLAMGCRERTRAQLKIPGTHPAGVYTAGTVQRMINREGWMPGKRFVILGSGDIGMIMARRITLEGGEVVRVLEALPFLTGLRRNYVQCLQDFGIELFLSRTITRIDGYERVEGVEVAPVDENLCPDFSQKEYIPCDTVVLSVGLIPENELSRKMGVVLDPFTGGPVVDQYSQTSVYGVFAAGNVVQIYDLVDDVSDHGALAGRYAACFARSLLQWQTPSLAFSWKAPLRSVVPQRILLQEMEENGLEVFCRVSRLLEHECRLVLRSDETVYYEKKLPFMRPAEMVACRLDKGILQQWKTHPPQRLQWEVV